MYAIRSYYAIAGAADAADGVHAHLLGQRELQARLDDGGGLTRARRADDDVSYNFV